MLNREQRRKLNKKHHVNYTADQWALIEMYGKIRAGDLDIKDLKELSPEVRANIHIDNEELVPEGTAVKLNVTDILTRPTKGVTQQFRDWIKAHEGEIMHVTREQAQSSLVCLAEDVGWVKENLTDTDKGNIGHVPWLFDIYSDLLYLDEATNEWITLGELEFRKENLENKS